jgi:hypothetical protein
MRVKHLIAIIRVVGPAKADMLPMLENIGGRWARGCCIILGLCMCDKKQAARLR